MRKFQLGVEMKLPDLIQIAQNKLDRKISYGLYKKENEPISESLVVFIDDIIEVDDDYNEIYPSRAIEKNLEWFYSDQNFQDVIDLAYKQKPSAPISKIIEALIHYSKNDDFLDMD